MEVRFSPNPSLFTGEGFGTGDAVPGQFAICYAAQAYPPFVWLPASRRSAQRSHVLPPTAPIPVPCCPVPIRFVPRHAASEHVPLPCQSHGKFCHSARNRPPPNN